MPYFGSLTAPDTVFDIQDGRAASGTGRVAVWGLLPLLGCCADLGLGFGDRGVLVVSGF